MPNGQFSYKTENFTLSYPGYPPTPYASNPWMSYMQPMHGGYNPYGNPYAGYGRMPYDPNAMQQRWPPPPAPGVSLPPVTAPHAASHTEKVFVLYIQSNKSLVRFDIYRQSPYKFTHYLELCYFELFSNHFLGP